MPPPTSNAFDFVALAVRTYVLDEVAANHEGGFASFKSQLFETCTRALVRLRTGGAFDAHPEVLVMFAVSDSEMVPDEELAMMARLNGDSPYVARYRRWTETWADRA